MIALTAILILAVAYGLPLALYWRVGPPRVFLGEVDL